MIIKGVAKSSKTAKKVVMTMQIEETLLKEINRHAKEYKVARQQLIQLILKAALTNPTFEINLADLD